MAKIRVGVASSALRFHVAGFASTSKKGTAASKKKNGNSEPKQSGLRARVAPMGWESMESHRPAVETKKIAQVPQPEKDSRAIIADRRKQVLDRLSERFTRNIGLFAVDFHNGKSSRQLLDNLPAWTAFAKALKKKSPVQVSIRAAEIKGLLVQKARNTQISGDLRNQMRAWAQRFSYIEQFPKACIAAVQSYQTISRALNPKERKKA